MRTGAILFFALVATSALKAQSDVSRFLASARNDNIVRQYDEQVLLLRDKSYRLAPIQRLELRTQNRELIRSQQEFAMRITPSNPWETRANNRYFESYLRAVELQRQVALGEALLERYIIAIEYFGLEEIQRLQIERLSMINRQLDILRGQTGSRFFDADDYVDLEIDWMDQSVELEELIFETQTRRQMIEKLGLMTVDSSKWASAQLLELEEIEQAVGTISQASAQSLSVQYQKHRLEMVNNQYQLEKHNINTGFIQGEYDNRRQEQGRTPFNISLGVTIPLFNPNKGDMTERKLRAIEELYELKNEERDAQLAQKYEGANVLRLCSRYRTLVKRIADYESSGVGNTLSTMQSGDPRIVVQFNENVLKLKLLAARVKQEARIRFVEYLKTADLLQQQPLRNYLLKGMPAID